MGDSRGGFGQVDGGMTRDSIMTIGLDSIVHFMLILRQILSLKILYNIA